MNYENSLHIFDLDDCLINTKQAYYSSYFKTIKTYFNLEKEETEPLLEGLISTFGSSNAKAIFLNINLSLGLKKHNEYQQFVTDFLKSYFNELKPEAQAIDYLERVIEKGAITALCSNGNGLIQRKKLNAMNLKQYFAEPNIYISEEKKPLRAKPYPDMLLALKKNYSQAEVIFYGNAMVDYLAALNADVNFLLYLEKSSKLNMIRGIKSINSWAELL